MNIKGSMTRYGSINKRNFRQALRQLLEQEYKILGSRKLIEMLTDDVENLYKEYYRERESIGFGEIVFRTTKDDGSRQCYGKKTEDYNTVTVVLPLITREDIEQRLNYNKKGDGKGNYKQCEMREIETMVRLLKSAKSQGGLLTSAELSILMNRSLTTLNKYLTSYIEETKEILPMKGYVLDQGSKPTHKGIIVSLYEQGISPADIVLKTGHSQTSVDRYIKHYEQVKKLLNEGMEEEIICEITGRSRSVVKQYVKLYQDLQLSEKT